MKTMTLGSLSGTKGGAGKVWLVVGAILSEVMAISLRFIFSFRISKRVSATMRPINSHQTRNGCLSQLGKGITALMVRFILHSMTTTRYKRFYVLVVID